MKSEDLGIISMVLKALTIGLVNLAFYVLVSRNLNSDTKPDEVSIQSLVGVVFLVWSLFTAWLIGQAAIEWKDTEKAVRTKNRLLFLEEAEKRIPRSVMVLYVIVGIFSLLTLHPFHLSGTLSIIMVHLIPGTIVALAFLVLLDLDDPTSGVINVEKIPDDWIGINR